MKTAIVFISGAILAYVSVAMIKPLQKALVGSPAAVATVAPPQPTIQPGMGYHVSDLVDAVYDFRDADELRKRNAADLVSVFELRNQNRVTSLHDVDVTAIDSQRDGAGMEWVHIRKSGDLERTMWVPAAKLAPTGKRTGVPSK